MATILACSFEVESHELGLYQSTLAKGNVVIANEIRLNYFAVALGKALTAPDVSAHLKNEIGKKFDGDYDALWKNVKGKSSPGKGTLQGIIASNPKGPNRVINSMAEIFIKG